MVTGLRWPRRTALLIALSLTAAFPVAAQERTGASPSVTVSPVEDPDESRRAMVLALLERPEVRDAARVAGVDLASVARDVEHLEGESLDRAARQAEALDRRLAIDGAISSTTLILLLIITVFLIVILQD